MPHGVSSPVGRPPTRAPLLWGACSAASMEVCLDENEERHGVRERNGLDSDNSHRSTVGSIRRNENRRIEHLVTAGRWPSVPVSELRGHFFTEK